MKKNILVFYGGKSVEHDISIITGLQVLRNIDKRAYNVIPVYIAKSGVWYVADNMYDANIYKDFEANAKNKRNVTLIMGKPYLIYKKGLGYKNATHIDCAILCNHGVNGEDGTLQGALEMSDIAYTSSGVLSSAITMDKIIMKDIFYANNIPCVKYMGVLRSNYESSKKIELDRIINKLSFPLIVKPSNLGSSIGIKKCVNIEDLEEALDVAFMYDSRVVVEKAVENLIEINCACIGTPLDNQTSNIEFPTFKKDILSYEDKYIDKHNEQNIVLGARVEKKVRELTKEVYELFSCVGVVRVDFLYDKVAKKLYVNELNSIPGSMAYYLFSPISFSSLIDELIDCAKISWDAKRKNSYSYNSSVLDLFSSKTDLNKYQK